MQQQQIFLYNVWVSKNIRGTNLFGGAKIDQGAFTFGKWEPALAYTIFDFKFTSIISTRFPFLSIANLNGVLELTCFQKTMCISWHNMYLELANICSKTLLHSCLLHSSVPWTFLVCGFYIYQVLGDKLEKPLNSFINFRISFSLTCESKPDISHQRQIRKIERKKKTNRMLVAISLAFFVPWAPLNVINLVMDIHGPYEVFYYIIFV